MDSTKIEVGEGLLEETFAVLRSCGGGARECVVHWLAPLGRQSIEAILHPRHSASAAGYQVDPAWLDATWRTLARERQQIVAQVHTHPGPAYHSTIDDCFPVIQTAGFLSLVIPNFAEGPVGLGGAFVATLDANGEWKERQAGAVLEVCR